MMRDHCFLLASAAGFVLASSPLSAQTDPRDPPPVTWCEKPSPRSEWKRQPVSFTLSISDSDSSEAQQRLAPYLPFMLSGIAERFIARQQPSRDVNAAKTRNLPPGEPRYSPSDLVHPLIVFDLLGSGAIDRIRSGDTTRSRLKADLVSALHSAAASGEVFGPYADPSVRTSLGLLASLGMPEDAVGWPAFTLHAPVDRPVMADPKNRPPSYPSDALRWNGRLLFQYWVDAEGRAVPGSASVLGAEDIAWPSNGHRQAYEKFKRQVEAAILRMRFFPAEENGCLIPSLVQQEFVFTHER